MLTVIVPGTELYNSETNEFVYTKSQILKLEHSLVSISKWESKWQKVFLSKKTEKTKVEALDYIRCMTLTQNVPLDVYSRIPPKVMDEISEYMQDPQSATRLPEQKGKGSKDVMSSEMLYYMMVANTLPVAECQKWHINRLLTLLRICSIKNGGGKKSKASSAEIARRNRERNAKNRAKANSKG